VDAQSVTERFLTAFYSGDNQGTRDAVTPDFTMLGPFATVHDADELLELSAGLMKIARGHKILRCVTAGDEVAALYEIGVQGPTGQGSLAVGGWFTVAGGRLRRGRVIYDSAAFAAIVSPS
jgi:SnoaL-like domain